MPLFAKPKIGILSEMCIDGVRDDGVGQPNLGGELNDAIQAECSMQGLLLVD